MHLLCFIILPMNSPVPNEFYGLYDDPLSVGLQQRTRYAPSDELRYAIFDISGRCSEWRDIGWIQSIVATPRQTR